MNSKYIVFLKCINIFKDHARGIFTPSHSFVALSELFISLLPEISVSVFPLYPSCETKPQMVNLLLCIKASPPYLINV